MNVYVLLHLIFKATLVLLSFFFIHEDTMFREVNNLPKVSWQVCGRIGHKSQAKIFLFSKILPLRLLQLFKVDWGPNSYLTQNCVLTYMEELNVAYNLKST